MRISIAILLSLIAIPCSATQTWVSVSDKSYIKFIAKYDDAAFEGQFKEFNSQFNFNANNITRSKLTSEINVTSVDTQSRDRDQALAENDWFYFSKFPQATFSSVSVNKVNEQLLEVRGLLTIREQKKEITFPMQWKALNDHQRQAHATILLDRRDYNIGIGEWLEDETIGFDVEVVFSITYEMAN